MDDATKNLAEVAEEFARACTWGGTLGNGTALHGSVQQDALERFEAAVEWYQVEVLGYVNGKPPRAE